MALVTANQFQLTPDITGATSRGLQVGEQFRQVQQRPQLEALRAAALEGSPEALQQLAAISPDQAQQVQVFQQNTFKNLDTRQQARVGSVAKGALQVQAIPSVQGKIEFLENRQSQLAQANIDGSDTQEVIDLYKAGNTTEADALINQMVGIGQSLGILEAPAQPQIKEVGGRLVSVTPTGVTEIPGQEAIIAAEGVSVSEVQSSKILPGGIVQIVRKDGTIETKKSSDLDAELIKRAEERGVDLQGERAQARGLGKNAAKKSQEAIDTIGKLRANNENLRQVITAVGDGAETGPLARRLPSFRAESIRLETLRNQLGLDVIGSVTLGAISESELDLALNTALPTGLEGPELIKWAQDKINAQEKLAAYLEDQAIFLGKRGNTVGKWIEQQKKEREETPETTGQKVGRFTVEVSE